MTGNGILGREGGGCRLVPERRITLFLKNVQRMDNIRRYRHPPKWMSCLLVSYHEGDGVPDCAQTWEIEQHPHRPAAADWETCQGIPSGSRNQAAPGCIQVSYVHSVRVPSSTSSETP
jgi:hypothetical protein